ncbi:MAG: helix-hairpin-helix domain-containing protein [Proteobacteria bacterium]|nr:helix-hairpin-helix domain-containing protein [Pseudomonadota bacterium]MBU1417087.1 helix-hairpin-helix domain-containing protein [Pseudomonadota bacterium]MBU1453783.1 helix-hairpin-helix domain-containing protein [Pseudomonadota bacterium]
MSSVTQKSIKDVVRKQKEGAATGVALCCCILLFSIQALSYLSSDSDLPVFRLQVSEGSTLQLSSIKASAGQSELINRISAQEHYRVTPFFFQPVPINFSDQSLLMTVKGIGPALAQRIINIRENAGPFIVPEDLLRVDGIGTARLQQFSPQFSFTRDFETN